MKKLILKLVSITLCLLTLPLSFIGCTENDTGFILDYPDGWKSVYMVGDDISLDGLKIKYYPNVDDLNTYQTIDVELNMIEGFDSSTAGNKTLTIKYKGLKTPEISYVVVAYVPFSVDFTYCISDNVIANINSTTNKATVTSYASFSDYVANDGVSNQFDLVRSIEAHPSFGVDYLSALSFMYQGTKISYLNVPNGNSYISFSSESLVSSKTAKPLTTPNLTATYQSDVKNGHVAIAKFDQNYGLNVYVVEEGTDISTVTPTATFTAENCVLKSGNAFTYTIDDYKVTFAGSSLILYHYNSEITDYTYTLNIVN